MNLLYKALEKKFEEGVTQWTDELKLAPNAYHNGEFNGNACRDLLHNIGRLEKLAKENEMGSDVTELIDCVKAFKMVVDACFGSRLGDYDYEMVIEEFRLSYMNLGLPIMPKVHTVFFHIAPFLQAKLNSHRLGFFSEQAVETAHALFNAAWQHYKSQGKKKYAPSLLSCVTDFNSKHI